MKKQRARKSKLRTAATMGPGKERFALADLLQTPRDFVSGELAKTPARRFEALCFDARLAPVDGVVAWIRGLDEIQDEEDANPKNERGYYIRRVVILKSRRVFTSKVPATLRDRPDITWIATSDPSDAPTIYRRHLTEQFQAVLGMFGRPAKKRRS
jgi:hypothetical protein